MKKLLFTLAISSVIASFALGADPELKDQKDKVSYSIGFDIGSNLKRGTVDVNQEAFARGIKDGLAAATPLLTKEQMKDTMMAFQTDLRAKQAAARKASGEKNKVDGEKFLADNKTKEGVKTTKSGLQYKVLKTGSGPTAKETDSVKVNYRGKTIDGKEFDSSYKRKEPATFPVGRVIKGWTEGLQLMNVGSKYQLFIPADLAYGERGAGQAIGPDSVLIFDVELLGIEPAPKSINPVNPDVIPGSKPMAGATGAAPSPSVAASPSNSPKEP